jgi:hypothetical protein
MEAKGSRHERSESRAPGFFSLLPPARIRARKAVSETLLGSFQVLFFHENEIKPLDIGFTPKSAKLAENRDFRGKDSVNSTANRGNCCIFLTVPKWNEPPVSRRPSWSST